MHCLEYHKQKQSIHALFGISQTETKYTCTVWNITNRNELYMHCLEYHKQKRIIHALFGISQTEKKYTCTVWNITNRKEIYMKYAMNESTAWQRAFIK